MKRNRKAAYRILLLWIVAAMLILVSCKSSTPQNGDATPNPVASPTGSGSAQATDSAGTAAPGDPTESATETTPGDDSPTDAPTEAPTAAPTRAPLTEEQKGKPFADGMEGLEVLFEADFSDGDYTVGGMTILSNDDGNTIDVVDEKLMLSYKDGGFYEKWCAWTPYLPVNGYDDYEQMELSFEYKWTKVSQSNPWIGLMIGCFVSNAGRICDTAGDGLWFGLSERSSCPIYGITSRNAGGWPDGAGSVPVPGGFSETRRMKVVCTNTRDCYLYVADADGVYSCWAEFHVGDDSIRAVNSKGQTVVQLENDGSTVVGGNFVFFNHLAGATIDDVRVLAY